MKLERKTHGGKKESTYGICLGRHTRGNSNDGKLLTGACSAPGLVHYHRGGHGSMQAGAEAGAPCLVWTL